MFLVKSTQRLRLLGSFLSEWFSQWKSLEVCFLFLSLISTERQEVFFSIWWICLGTLMQSLKEKSQQNICNFFLKFPYK